METYRPGEKKKVTPEAQIYNNNPNMAFNPTGYFSAPGVEAPAANASAGAASADPFDAVTGFTQAGSSAMGGFGASAGMGGVGTNPGDFMDMNSGFESGPIVTAPVLSGIGNIASIASSELVAKSFIFMFAALIITTVAALTTSPATAIFFLEGYNYWIFVGAELAIVFGANWAAKKNNYILAGILFAAYSYMTGMLFSIFFIIFQLQSIVAIFGACSLMFGITAVIGLVTKKDLTSAGNLCLMALLGIILVSSFNMFLIKSSGLDYIISIFGVLIFVGLTAYDAQKIKELAARTTPDRVISAAMIGALNLYLDFINLFLRLLRLFGKRK